MKSGIFGRFYFIAFLALLLAAAPDANAIHMHRCNGRIQYRPCTDKSTSTAVRPFRGISDQYARVVSSEFSGVTKQEGIWRGSVAGNGKVHLRLFIRKNGVVESSRYMGNVDLADRETTFAFRSVTPKGKDWSWDIVAYNG